MSTVPGDSFSSILSRFTKSTSPPGPPELTTQDHCVRRPKQTAAVSNPQQEASTREKSGKVSVMGRLETIRPPVFSQLLTEKTSRLITTSAVSPAEVPKRRKLNQPPKTPEPLTEKQKELAARKKKLMAITMMKDKSGSPSSALTSTKEATSAKSINTTRTEVRLSVPSGTESKLKGPSYQETLARAAQQYESRKAIAGTITHKARAPLDNKKAWQKRLADKQKLMGDSGSLDTGKSVGAASGEKVLSNESGKYIHQKKPTTNTNSSSQSDKRNNVNPKVHRDSAIKRKRGPESIAGKEPKKTVVTGYRGVSKKFQSSRRHKFYEQDDEDDDWIVDDEGRNQDGYTYGYAKRYRYAESDYDSESDMEAAGADVLEEEERSRRAAIKEDQEQEKLEAELAARKAALKRSK